MIEIRNKKVIIDGYAIGNEEELLAICNKAKKFDDLKASFEKRGDVQ
jgi:hypothetical protein